MMSSETACFNGYAEEFLEVQMADAMPLKLFTDWTLQGMDIPILFFCSPELDIKLLMKA